MSDNVLQLFEGLTPREAKRLREAIIPTLTKLRQEIKEQKDMNEKHEVPESVRQQALAEAAQLYAERMRQEEAKTAEDREAEELEAQIDAVSVQLAQMRRTPSKYGTLLHAKQAEFEKLYAKLQAAGRVKENPKREERSYYDDFKGVR